MHVLFVNMTSMGIVSSPKLAWVTNFIGKELHRDGGSNSMAIILLPNRYQQTEVWRSSQSL